MVAVHPALSNEDRILITKQLLKACDSNSRTGFIPNQVGDDGKKGGREEGNEIGKEGSGGEDERSGKGRGRK